MVEQETTMTLWQCRDIGTWPQWGTGVALVCLAQPRGAVGTRVACLRCGQPVRVDWVALTAWAGGEVLGYLGPCCLRADARARLAAKCREYEAAGTGEGGS